MSTQQIDPVENFHRMQQQQIMGSVRSLQIHIVLEKPHMTPQIALETSSMLIQIVELLRPLAEESKEAM